MSFHKVGSDRGFAVRRLSPSSVAVGRSSWVGTEGDRFSCDDVEFVKMVKDRRQLEMVWEREKTGLLV